MDTLQTKVCFEKPVSLKMNITSNEYWFLSIYFENFYIQTFTLNNLEDLKRR